jgi:hypothetical protein
MTNEQKIQQRKLEKQIHYGRGITPQQWDVLIELRKIDLTARGLNPNHFNLDSRYCEKKLSYR